MPIFEQHNPRSFYVDVIDFLKSQRICVLSSLSPEGKPQSATVFYHLGDIASPKDFRLYVLTRQHTRKLRNIEANPAVSMVVGTNLEPFTAQIEGNAEVVERADHIDHLVDFSKRLLADPQLGMIYVGAFFPENPFGQLGFRDLVVLRITPTWVRFMRRDEEQKAIVYDQLLP